MTNPEHNESRAVGEVLYHVAKRFEQPLRPTGRNWCIGDGNGLYSIIEKQGLTPQQDYQILYVKNSDDQDDDLRQPHKLAFLRKIFSNADRWETGQKYDEPFLAAIYDRGVALPLTCLNKDSLSIEDAKAILPIAETGSGYSEKNSTGLIHIVNRKVAQNRDYFIRAIERDTVDVFAQQVREQTMLPLGHTETTLETGRQVQLALTHSKPTGRSGLAVVTRGDLSLPVATLMETVGQFNFGDLEVQFTKSNRQLLIEMLGSIAAGGGSMWRYGLPSDGTKRTTAGLRSFYGFLQIPALLERTTGPTTANHEALSARLYQLGAIATKHTGRAVTSLIDGKDTEKSVAVQIERSGESRYHAVFTGKSKGLGLGKTKTLADLKFDMHGNLPQQIKEDADTLKELAKIANSIKA